MLIEGVRSPVIEVRTPDADAAASTPFIARFLPSLTDIAFLMPIMFIFVKLAGARTLLGDGDTLWHIRAGEWILAHHQAPQTDFFSYSRPGAPWFAWEWLSEVLMALTYRLAGLPAIVIAGTATVCITSVVLFRLIRRKCGNGLVSIAVTLLATGGCAIHWLARPHLLSLLIFACVLHLTERARENRPNLLWWLIPIELLWTNLHGGFFVMFLLLPCYIVSDLINAAIDPDPVLRRGYLRNTRPWLTALAGCFAVTFINPYGWQLHTHLIEYITDPYQLQHITEFQSMNFHAPVSVYFEPLMFGTIAASFWALSRRRFADVILALGWMHLALIAQRNLPLFSIAAAPLVAEGITHLLKRTRFATTSVDETDRIPRFHLVSIAAISIVALLLLAPKPLSAKFISTYDPAFYPEKAIPLLLAPDVHHIFTEDEWGDYLIWNLYPKKGVFIDGRSDFYGDKFGEEYLRLMEVQTGWNNTLDRYGVDTIILSPKFALSSTLKISRDWRLVYDDHVALVFRRVSPVTSAFVSDGEATGRDLAIAKTATN